MNSDMLAKWRGSFKPRIFTGERIKIGVYPCDPCLVPFCSFIDVAQRDE